MTQTNLSGLAGVAIGGGVGYGLGHVLAANGLPLPDAIACGTIAGCLSTSMFGLLYDRSVVPEFRRSYRVLTAHYVPQTRSGPDYDPRERLASFGIPVAFATFILPFAAALLWFVRPDPTWVGVYVVAGILGVAATMIVGNATADHRLLQREIAFNTTPVLGGAALQAPSKTKTKAAHLHAPTPAQGRKQALVSIALGLLLLAMNHYFAVHEGQYWQKAVFLGPMAVMVGIFGLFEPRIMSRHLPVGKTYPITVLLLMLLAIAIGAAGGFQIDAWYHG